jgi:hypothetical protein
MQTAIIYNHETVALDGESFADCEFRGCRMVYKGGELPHFSDCRFDDCDWKFEDAAARTLAYMKVVWGVGGKAPIQNLIKTVTGGGGGR